jgi:cytochrome P450
MPESQMPENHIAENQMTENSTTANETTMESDELGPFERFNRLMGADRCRTPYPEFAAMRAEGPVLRRELESTLGLSEDALRSGNPELYLAVSHDAVAQVLRDGDAFSSGAYRESMGIVMGPNILVMDEPEHGRFRNVIQAAFSKKAVEDWERGLIRPIVENLIDRFVNHGRADLVRELTFPFPVHVIAGMLDLPRADIPIFHGLTVDLISVAFDWQRGLEASSRLAEYLTPLIEARRKRPADDLISQLAISEVDGRPLDNAHVLGFLRLLLPAGAETTYRSSSNLLFGLLTHPDQMKALDADRSLLLPAIEEGLRWEVPLTSISRLCTRDTEVEGVLIPAHSLVEVVIGAANHDETRFERAEEFDIHRPPRPHLSFAFGPHRCLGMHLARTEMQVVIEAVLDRLPNLRLDPTADDVHITGRGFRAPRELPVLFD